MTKRGSKTWWAWAAVSLVAAAGGGVGACSGEDQTAGVGTSKLPQGGRSESIDREACNESGNKVEVLDANGDGKPDVKRVYDKGTGKEICRISDLNHDGKPDLYEYYDANGVIRRREADYDDNGVIDAIEFYEDGKLVRREYDTTGQHRIDTWDYFDKETGRKTRRERDTNNDGRVDQWWAWEGDRVTIALDKNGDGKPDPDATLVLSSGPDGGIGSAIAPAASSAPAGPPPPPSLETKAETPQQADMVPLDGGASPGDAAAVGPKRKERR